ncbi:hypothetical protein [Niastella vici]|nr:hypothetical protein [Niastella vici]
MVLQTTKGYPEILLLGPCDISLFYKVADWLGQNIGLTFSNNIENAGANFWEFQFMGATLQLQYIPALGIFICPKALINSTEHDKASLMKLLKEIQFEGSSTH